MGRCNGIRAARECTITTGEFHACCCEKFQLLAIDICHALIFPKALNGRESLLYGKSAVKSLSNG